jgi:antitoxin component HigA of HigAB toxin-antitoxin module
MTIKPIRNENDLKRAFRRLEKIFQAEEGTAQADERDVLVTLVEAYESKHYDFGALSKFSLMCPRLKPITGARRPAQNSICCCF